MTASSGNPHSKKSQSKKTQNSGVGKRIPIDEVTEALGLQRERIENYIRNEWIIPCRADPCELDEEDQARVLLIVELEDDFEINPAGIPIILHLIDQIHYLRLKLRKSFSS